MIRKLLSGLAFAVCVVAVQPAVADTLFSQPYSTANAYTSAASTGYQAFDSFTLASSATVGTVSWNGVYATAQPTSFVIDFYSNAGGAPGALLFTDTVTSGAMATGDTTYGYQIYGYSADIGSFGVVGGTEYWLSVVGQGPNAWYWSTASGGTAAAYQAHAAVPTDLAFGLATAISAAPEPSEIVLTSTGLIGMLGVARRRFVRS
jgi:hypothetical protein